MLRFWITQLLLAALCAASIFFFYQQNFIIAVLLLVLFISRLIVNSAKVLEQRMMKLDLERNCNYELEFHIGIEEVLKHPSIDRLFNALSKKEFIPSSIRKEDWIETLLETYKKKYGKEDNIEHVTFNIKNKLLWKNREISFLDSIYHNIFIPYEYKDGKEEDKLWFLPTIKFGITIRLLMVNGIIKLQVGEFSKEYTSNMISDTKHQCYDTVTSFPLMYFSWELGIPEHYLNITWQGLESVAEQHNMAEWKELNREIEDYNYVCSVYSANKRTDTINTKFKKKKKAWLIKENFVLPKDEFDFDHDEDEVSLSGLGIGNKYLNIQSRDFKDNREKMERGLYGEFVDSNDYL